MGKIVLNDIKKNYYLGKNVVEALKGIDLEINQGEFMAVAGSSGSGKTTLLNIIGAIDTPSGGSYYWDKESIESKNDRYLTGLRRDKIGYIFQTFNLVPVLSAYENIEYPLLLDKTMSNKERKQKVLGILEKVGLADKAHNRPNELSGGQRQRVAIARALIKNPEVILADEPTANLDSSTGLAIIELMKELNKENKTTFIFSSHDPKVIEHANRIEYIVDGKIIKEEKRHE